MRVISIVIVMALAGVVHAQPGMSQPTAPYPMPPPQYPMVPPPYAYAPVPQLTADERELLADGEITDGEQVAGGLAAIFLGFGIGQAIEHRWHELGWVFTLGETATFGLFIYGMSQEFSDCYGPNPGCPSSSQNNGGTYMLIGALGLTALRIWETVDAFTGPRTYNRRFYELRARAGVPQYYGLRPYVVPTSTGGGALAGLALRF